MSTEAQRYASSEKWAYALAAYERAFAIAPACEALKDKVEQTKPLAAMQNELTELRSKQNSFTSQIAAAALSPPRRGKSALRDCKGANSSATHFINGAEVLRLLDQGSIQINEQDEHGRTPLLWATVHGMDDLVKLILSQRSPDRANPDVAGL